VLVVTGMLCWLSPAYWHAVLVVTGMLCWLSPACCAGCHQHAVPVVRLSPAYYAVITSMLCRLSPACCAGTQIYVVMQLTVTLCVRLAVSPVVSGGGQMSNRPPGYRILN